MMRSANRWALAFFFALVAFPFASVWYSTQAARVADALSPIYTVSGVGEIERTATGLIFHAVSFDKHFSCHPDGVLYVSIAYREGLVEGEVLIPTERGVDGKPFFVRSTVHPGAAITVPQIKIITSREVLDRVDTIRFVIPCDRPILGPTRAYTNPVKLG